jgi:hypothetical protein
MINQGTIMLRAVESRVNAVATRDMVGLWLGLVQLHIQNSTYLLLTPTLCYI